MSWIITSYLFIGLILESVYIYRNKKKLAPSTWGVAIIMLLWYSLEIILWPLYLLRGVLIHVYLDENGEEKCKKRQNK
jgi:hypothetical protein